MRIAAIVLGALAAIVLVVVAIGYTLPVTHRASREVTFRAAPATLWALVTDVERYPTWRTGVKRVELLAAEGSAPRFREESGDGTITYAVESDVPERRRVTRIADKSLPFGGAWTYELVPAANGTTLRITEDGEVYNPVFRFVSRFVMGHTRTIDGYLHDVGKRLGEEVAVR